MRFTTRIAAILASTLLIAGCGGGSDNVAQPSGAAPIPTVLSVPPLGTATWNFHGVLSGSFAGQFHLDRVPCPLADPAAPCIETVTLDGEPATLAALADGAILDLARAGSPRFTVDVQRAVVGPVEAVDADRQRIIVLGQDVFIDSETRGDRIDVSTVAVGEVLAISGFVAPGGLVVATRVDAYVGTPLFLVRGVLAAGPSGSFSIGALAVDLAAASRENFPGGAPLVGDAVVAFSEQPPVNATFAAARVRNTAAGDGGGGWKDGEATGFVTGWRSAYDFDIDGHTVRPGWCECVYISGSTVGSFVWVGLTAGNAAFEPALRGRSTVRLSGPIKYLAASQWRFTVNDVDVFAHPATLIADTVEWDPGDLLALSDLAEGDGVTVFGSMLGDTFIAAAISRTTGATPYSWAVKYSLQQPYIRIAGTSILTDSSTLISRCDQAPPRDIDAFFATDWSTDLTLEVALVAGASPPVAASVRLCPLYWD